MDITQAILLSICGNFATDAVRNAVRNSYVALKKALTAKYGQNSDLCDAINKLEKAPDRKDRQETLEIEVKLAKADNDPELSQLAHKLLNKLNYQLSEQVSMIFKDNEYACGSGTGNSTINIHNNTK